jgi:hypothetical protein
LARHTLESSRKRYEGKIYFNSDHISMEDGMRKVACIAIISIVFVMSGCAIDSLEDQDDLDDSLSEIESAALYQCPANAVCAWSQLYFEGAFSWWPYWATGCHDHANNPYIRSGYNNTGYWVRFGGVVTLAPYSGFAVNPAANPITGRICWPVY